ncbi:MAG: DUF423 domain-containing protein [Mangrovibacterium sp.]
MARTILVAASFALAFAVIIGAFGAHGLKSRISPDMLQVYKTGVEYHFCHALGLLAIGILALQAPSKYLKLAAIFISAGLLLFSGSLYALAITGVKWIGAITPLGGLSFIAGWVFLGLSFFKR